MSVRAVDAAWRICRNGDWKVTNLALQKILYMAHMVFWGRFGEGLIREQFEAWDYGPVQPELYRRVRVFGANPVGDVFHEATDISGTREAAVIDEACDHLLTRRPAELVAMTHMPNSAWASRYRPGVRGIVIPDGEILDEYRRRTAA